MTGGRLFHLDSGGAIYVEGPIHTTSYVVVHEKRILGPDGKPLRGDAVIQFEDVTFNETRCRPISMGCDVLSDAKPCSICGYISDVKPCPICGYVPDDCEHAGQAKVDK